MAKVEICVDNLESIVTANRFPIDRIELCCALSVGGISPSYGLLKQAINIAKIPLAVMVRIRSGDFIFSKNEIQAMETEIELAKALGVKHIVIGALSKTGDIDLVATQRFVRVADGMEITFHRAFDLCRDPFLALEQLIDLGCHRLLTSGQAKNAFNGIPLLKKLVEKADNRIQIMAGCGVNSENVQAILSQTKVPEIHFSAKGFRLSEMVENTNVSMGHNCEQDNKIEIIDQQKLTALLSLIEKAT